MRRAADRLAPLALLLLAACHPRVRPSAVLPPLGPEGEVRVYLQPLPEDAPRLSFSLTHLAATRPDGTAAQLALALGEVSPETGSTQRLLAAGRLAPGSYDGLTIQLQRATLSTDDGVADLLVPEEPIRVAVSLEVARGRALLVRLTLRPGQAPDESFDFSGAFAAAAYAPAAAAVQSSGYCSTPDLASLSQFDRRTRQVTAVIPTGRAPRGLAVDPAALRAYVALAGEDQIQVLDLATGEELRRISLRAGDEPSEVALAGDGRTLVVANRRSNSLAFADVDAASAGDRVEVGEEPVALILDGGGRRAYVVGRRTNDVTVVDVGNRAVVGRAGTEPEPLRAQLSRTGDRLFVIHRGSPYMGVYSVPGLAQVSRIYVGLGTSALKVDPRTGLVYVGHADGDRIQVFDPGSLLPVDEIAVPGPVSFLGLDPLNNALVALVPSRGMLAFVDLTRRRMVASLDVGAAPYAVTTPRDQP